MSLNAIFEVEDFYGFISFECKNAFEFVNTKGLTKKLSKTAPISMALKLGNRSGFTCHPFFITLFQPC